MPRLERTSLPEQLAQAITKEIATGVWRDRLPGYRLLGKRYDVSRPTCESAIRILEADGVIGPAEPGKMRPILRKKIRKQTSAKLQLLIVIDSRHPPTPMDDELIAQIENFWKAEGGEVSRVSCDLMRLSRPGHLLKKWLRTSGADCLLFETITPEWIVPLEKLGLPCYALGGSVTQGQGVLSGSGFRIVECIENLLRETLELGHRRIMLVMGRATPEEEMRGVIKNATDPILAEKWGGEEASLSVMIPDMANPTDWQDWWQRALLSECPTVVMLDSVYQGISLHAFCLRRGIQMPHDMSMLVLEDAEFLAWLSPLPTRYRYKKDDGFRHFRNWVRGGFVQDSVKSFGAELVGGETLGPPPERAPEIGE